MAASTATKRLAFIQPVGECCVMIRVGLGVGRWSRHVARGVASSARFEWSGGSCRASAAGSRTETGPETGGVDAHLHGVASHIGSRLSSLAWTGGSGGAGVIGERGSATQRAVLILLCWLVLGTLLLNALSGPHPGTRGTSSAPGAPATATSPSSHAASAPARAGGHHHAAPPAPAAPSAIRVLVANGTTVSGAATRFSGALRTAGYNVLAPVNSTVRAASSVVYFQKGDRADALSVAQFLGVGSGAVQPAPASPPVQSTMGAMVLVIVGPDLADQATPSASSGAG